MLLALIKPENAETSVIIKNLVVIICLNPCQCHAEAALRPAEAAEHLERNAIRRLVKKVSVVLLLTLKRRAVPRR